MAKECWTKTFFFLLLLFLSSILTAEQILLENRSQKISSPFTFFLFFNISDIEVRTLSLLYSPFFIFLKRLVCFLMFDFVEMFNFVLLYVSKWSINAATSTGDIFRPCSNCKNLTRRKAKVHPTSHRSTLNYSKGDKGDGRSVMWFTVVFISSHM